MRRSIVAAVAFSLTVAMAACGGGSGPAGSESPGDGKEMSKAPKAAGKLTVWTDETRVKAFKALGKEFKATSGVTLDVVQKPTDDIRKEFVAQAPTGQGPDLVVIAHDNTGELVKNGVVAPLELGDKLDGMAKVAVDAFKYDGQLYGVPYAIENVALVRNNKLVKETPDTFDALLEAKPKGAKYPILIQQGAEGDAYHLYPIQTSFGAPVFKQDDTGSYTNELGMTGENGAKFAKYLTKMAKAGAVNPSIGGDQAKQLFLDGKSPYMITGPWWTSDFVKKGMDISVLPVPSAGGQPSAPFVGVQGVYLSTYSKNALLANQFLDYLATEEAQKKLYDIAGRVPAHSAAAASVDDKILVGFAEAGKQGVPMPAIPEMGSVWKFWGGTELSIIKGKASDPAAAWDKMNKNIQAAFKKK